MELRLGQIAFNELYATEPTIANLIRGSEFDPFYDDEKLEAFYEKVAELRNLT
jgi:hypothetical protein